MSWSVLSVAGTGFENRSFVVRLGETLLANGSVRSHMTAGCNYEERWTLTRGLNVFDMGQVGACRSLHPCVFEGGVQYITEVNRAGVQGMALGRAPGVAGATHIVFSLPVSTIRLLWVRGRLKWVAGTDLARGCGRMDRTLPAGRRDGQHQPTRWRAPTPSLLACAPGFHVEFLCKVGGKRPVS